MTNRELLNLLKDLEFKNPEILDDEVRILFMDLILKQLLKKLV